MQRIDTLHEDRTNDCCTFYLQMCSHIRHAYRHKNACKVFDFLCVGRCVSFVSFCPLRVGRGVIRACVSIMPREYQRLRQLIQFDCVRSPNGEVNNNNVFERMTDLWGPQYKRCYSQSIWIYNVSSDLDPKNSKAMTNGRNERALAENLFQFLFYLIFSLKWHFWTMEISIAARNANLSSNK